MKRIEIEQNTPKWLEWRKGGIGSSDIAKIMGVSPFGTALDVYNEKAGIGAEKKQTSAMRTGHQYEDSVRLQFSKDIDRVYEPICFESLLFPYMRASLDGYNELTQTLIEIKVPGKKDWDLAKQGKVPEYYNIQIQWQLKLSNCHVGFFVCYNPKLDEYIYVLMHRDEPLMNAMTTAAIQFWNEFLQGIPPAFQNKDYHLVTDDQFLTYALAARKIRKELDHWEAMWDDVKSRILKFSTGSSFKGDGITVCKTNGRKTYDIEAMAKDGIDIEKYAKIGQEGWTVKIDKKNFD